MDVPIPDGTYAGTTASDGVGERLGLLIFKAGHAVMTRAEPSLEAQGICAREYIALAILDRDAPGSQQQLATLMGKAPAIVVAIVDELERKGLVERVRSPSDRRRITVVPTEAGLAALQAGDAATAAVEAEIFGALPDAERAQLHVLLRRALTSAPPVAA